MYTLLNNNLNITENHLKILSLFSSGYNKSLYIREVNRMLKISPRTAQIILNDLENKGILESITRGKIKTYVLRKSQTSKYYLTLAEIYKTTLFTENNPLIKEVIETILPLMSGIGLIFGSYAKGEQKEGSDLDVFLVGHTDNQKIRAISKAYGIDINLITYSFEKYKSAIEKDIFLSEVLQNHIVISNIDGFVSSVMENE